MSAVLLCSVIPMRLSRKISRRTFAILPFPLFFVLLFLLFSHLPTSQVLQYPSCAIGCCQHRFISGTPGRLSQITRPPGNVPRAHTNTPIPHPPIHTKFSANLVLPVLFEVSLFFLPPITGWFISAKIPAVILFVLTKYCLFLVNLVPLASSVPLCHPLDSVVCPTLLIVKLFECHPAALPFPVLLDGRFHTPSSQLPHHHGPVFGRKIFCHLRNCSLTAL